MDYVHVPWKLLEKIKEVVMKVKVMFVNDLTSIVRISRKMKLIMGNMYLMVCNRYY